MNFTTDWKRWYTLNELCNKGSTLHKIGAQRRKLAEYIKCSAGIKSQQQYVGPLMWKIAQGPCGVCFMWLEGLKHACTLVRVEMLKGLSDFPSDVLFLSLPLLLTLVFSVSLCTPLSPSLSFMSLERFWSLADSNVDCLGVIYVVIRAVPWRTSARILSWHLLLKWDIWV